MEMQYVTFREPEYVAMTMLHGPFCVERFAGSWRFKVFNPAETTVTFRYAFSTRYPLLRPLLDALITRVFLRDIRTRLRGLKTCVESTDILSRLS